MGNRALVIAIGFIIGFSSTVMAKDKEIAAGPLAVCEGSAFEDGSLSEQYRIYLTDENQVLVYGSYKSTKPIIVDLNNRKAKVLVTDNQIKIRAEKKMMGILKYNDLEIDIDFNSGRGLVSNYVAIESLLKSKKIYLEDCRQP